MRMFKSIVFIVAVSLFAACGSGNNKEVSVEGFIDFAQRNGFSFKEVDYGHENSARIYFSVTPGRMDISFEEMQDAKTAKHAVKQHNTDLDMVRKVVAKDNTHASEMGWTPEAFANGNLVLFVPLNYVVHYSEAKALIGLFESY